MADTGGITTQGTRTFFFGTSSGINTSALIEAAYNQRVAEADKLDTRVTNNTKKYDAYTKLQTLSQAVQTSLTTLRKSYSVLGDVKSSFDSRSATLSSNTSTDATKILGVAIDAGTPKGSYDIEIVQKAKNHRVASTATADPTVALNQTGTFDVGIPGKTAGTINVTSGMSLNDLAAAINAQSTTTGVSASVLKVSSNSYQLIMSATDTAKEIAVTNVTGSNVLDSIGVTSGGAFVNELQPADQAIVVLDGVTVTRDTNTISDLIDGVELVIAKQEPGTTVTLEIGDDTSKVKDAIVGFVNAYNELRQYIAANQVVTDGEVSEDAVLFSDVQLKNLTDSVQTLINGSFGSGGTTMATLRELGITQDGDNNFLVDEAKLDVAIVSKFDEVRSIFETKITNANPEFAMLGNSSRLKSANISFDITVSGGVITGVSANGDSSLFDFSGTSITGKAGSIYEGMRFAYIGTSSATISFGLTQGLGDLLDNTLDTFADAVTGSLQSQKISLNDQNKDLSTRAGRVRERADDFRNSLIDRYARFESQIAQSKSVLNQIKAILGTNDE